MSPSGLEPTISADEQPQTFDLDRAATWTGMYGKYYIEIAVILKWDFIIFKLCVFAFALRNSDNMQLGAILKLDLTLKDWTC